uniref:Ig-like domain-containing protein n=1 Tax=Leptobrachium leishanense TaxID=445787 RepID=A0A8C5PAD2_9ANUR
YMWENRSCMTPFIKGVLSQAVTLDQPGSIVVKPSETLKISCKVSESITYNDWAWLRQKTGSGLENIGYINSIDKTYYAPAFQGKVTVTRDTSKKEFYLKMPNMRNYDSGKYYCARDVHTVITGKQGSL